MATRTELKSIPRMIETCGLLPDRARILVAVSGGADSVALLHALHELASCHHWHLTVGHLDHGIRGKAAWEDAEFVKAVARRLEIPCIVGKARVPALAKRLGISLEMAARQARYAFLARTSRAILADCIATAHTADDQAETILLKLIRGAGRTGLTGISATTTIEGVKVVRPLLEVTRGEIETYLKRRRISWREDATNRDSAFLRNRVRHELLPLLEREYNPGVRGALLKARDVLAAEDEWLDHCADRILTECAPDEVLDGGLLAKHPLAARRRVIRAWLRRQGAPVACLEFDMVRKLEALVGKNKGSETVSLAGGWVAQREYAGIRLIKPSRQGVGPERKPVLKRVKGSGTTLVPAMGLCLKTEVAPGVVMERGKGPGVLPARATLDAGVLAGRALAIRWARPGDRMTPYGMKGSRKLQDILVDAKVPRAGRARIPVLECEGEIVWLPGYRIASNWAVQDPAGKSLQLVMGRI